MHGYVDDDINDNVTISIYDNIIDDDVIISMMTLMVLALAKMTKS